MRRQGVADNPVLVGAGAILVILVMVLLSYNANEGLPFVPTYNVEAEVPSGANLVSGNDVRIGGARVGLITTIRPARRANGKTYALVHLKLEQRIGPIPTDSRIVVRPRSTIGLKYVQLSLGSSNKTIPDGGVLPISQSTYASEFEDLLNTFSRRVRVGNKASLDEFGNAFAGRGVDLNTAFGELPQLFSNLRPVARTISDPSARFADFIEAITKVTVDIAPVADQAGEVFANADKTFGALATATDGIAETLAESPATLDTATTELPKQRPYFDQLTGVVRAFKPSAKYLPAVADDLAVITTKGIPALRHLDRTGPKLNRTFDNIANFAADPLVQLGVKNLVTFASVINEPLKTITPSQTVCNYAGLFARNLASAVNVRESGFSWLRFGILPLYANSAPGQNSELSPSSGPANVSPYVIGQGEVASDLLHANPYPYTASPGQPSVCAAGNEVTKGVASPERRDPEHGVPSTKGFNLSPQVETTNPSDIPAGTRTEDTRPVDVTAVTGK
jgi:virulence factor Mce-like protein